MSMHALMHLTNPPRADRKTRNEHLVDIRALKPFLEKITVGYTLTPAQHGFIRQLPSFTTSRQASDATNIVMVGPPEYTAECDAIGR